MSSSTTQTGTAVRTQARVRTAVRAMSPYVTLLIAQARRVVNAGSFARMVAAWFRGWVRFFIWYRAWLKAEDKAYLIEKGASSLNRSQHQTWCYWRKRTSGMLAGTLFIAIIVAYWMWGALGILPFWLALSIVLVAMGRKRPIARPKMAPSRPPITDSFVRQVVASATQGMKPEDWELIRMITPVSWDSTRQWWQVTFEMPGTVPGENVRKAKPGLMSGFGVGPMQLFIDVKRTNTSVVTITATTEDPWARPPTRSPLEDAETFSVWDPVPLAVDGRGRRISVSLMFTGWLIGAVPRMGKSAMARLLAMAAALDPWCDLVIFDLKGSADWRMFKPLCRAFGLGHTDKTIGELLRVLEKVQKEIDRRSEVVGNLDLDRCPDGHVTRELALDPELGLQPLILIIDEVQWAFQHRLHRKKILELVENIVKGGQYVGVTIILATQKPDSKSVPTEVRDVIASRAALHCKTRQASETILGTSAYGEGWDAASLPPLEGLAILYGEEEDAGLAETTIARTDYANIPAATAVAARAALAREKVGRLPKQRQVDPLIGMCRQIQGSRRYIPAAELIDVLSIQPEYAERPWTSDSLGKALRSKGYASFPMTKTSTGDAELADSLKNRMAYNFLTTVEEDATL